MRGRLAAGRSAGGIRRGEVGGRLGVCRCGWRRLDLQAGERKLDRCEARPPGSFQTAATAVIVAATAVEGTDGRLGLRRFCHATVAAHDRVGGRRGLVLQGLARRPAHAGHPHGRGAGQRQRRKSRDEHNQQQRCGSPAMHDCFISSDFAQADEHPTVCQDSSGQYSITSRITLDE